MRGGHTQTMEESSPYPLPFPTRKPTRVRRREPNVPNVVLRREPNVPNVVLRREPNVPNVVLRTHRCCYETTILAQWAELVALPSGRQLPVPLAGRQGRKERG